MFGGVIAALPCSDRSGNDRPDGRAQAELIDIIDLEMPIFTRRGVLSGHSRDDGGKWAERGE